MTLYDLSTNILQKIISSSSFENGEDFERVGSYCEILIRSTDQIYERIARALQLNRIQLAELPETTVIPAECLELVQILDQINPHAPNG